jgi:hypothetical protein
MQGNRKMYAASAASILLVAGMAQAQSFNIDIDSNFAGTWQGAPTAAFGAGASQPGTWNAWQVSVTQTNFPLVGLNGSATIVTISASTIAAGNPGFAFDNAGTTGDVQLLMDDGYDLSGADIRSVTIAGLAAGTYDVFSYGWAPDVPGADLTDITIEGNLLTAGSAFGSPPPFENPGHFVMHTVTVSAGGSIVITANGNGLSFGTLNGLQIRLQDGAKCPADTNNSGVVDVDDLVAVILGWGACAGCPPTDCASDIDDDCDTDVDDLVAVILAWGPC